jgi:iron complex outermembrane receptor protein
LRHTIAAGGDWYLQRSQLDSIAVRVGVPGLSLVNPVYGLTSGADYDFNTGTAEVTDTRSHRSGLLLQDQIDIGRFILVGGARRDWFDDRDDHAGDPKVSGHRTSWRTGAIYKPAKRISLYASHSQSFEPQDPGDQNASAGGPFAPVASRQIEVGAKGRTAEWRTPADHRTLPYRLPRHRPGQSRSRPRQRRRSALPGR